MEEAQSTIEPPPCGRYHADVNEFQPLIDQLRREEILRARAMTPEERIAQCLAMSEANIAWSYGEGDAELSRRLARLRQVRDARTYVALATRS